MSLSSSRTSPPNLSETYVPANLDPKHFMRSQADSSADHALVSAQCDIFCTEDGARQEFRDECDINHQIERILRGELPVLRPDQFGEVDFDLTFHQAKEVVREADRAYSLLPLAVRQRFPSWQALAAAVAANPDLFNTSTAVDGVSPSTEGLGAPAGVVPDPKTEAS